MSDMVVVVRRGHVLFAMNEQREANEAQMLDWQPAAHHCASDRLQLSAVELPQASHTHAILLCRPYWAWGAEVGANEHGVSVGCTAVLTRQPTAAVGLRGTELVRLALERASSAQQGVDWIVGLLEAHGQAAAATEHGQELAAHTSFVVADPGEAYLLETAGSLWAVDRIRGVAAVSSCLSIPSFADRHADWIRSRLTGAICRSGQARALGEQARSAADLAALLRHHGGGTTAPKRGWLGAPQPSLCMHGSRSVLGAHTTASWISELAPGNVRHWATATSMPCLSLFKPVRVGEPLAVGPAPSARADEANLWWRHEKLHRQVMRASAELAPLVTAERDLLEREWLASPPAPAEAFAQAERWLSRVGAKVRAARVGDTRPRAARRYWHAQDRAAGLS